EDYEIAAGVLRPLEDAGIKVVHAMGNHDMRAEFLKAFPKQGGTTKVPGRLVSFVETPHVDFIVLDSLLEPAQDRRGVYGAMTRQSLGDAQLKWLDETVASAKKPLFICAHHPHHGLKIPMRIAKNPIVAGYIHGHTHVWTTGYMRGDFDDDARMLRTVGLPTFGFEMDVGWGLMRTDGSGASLGCMARDYYYPLPRAKEARPAEWDVRVGDWRGREIGFRWA
ncbi:MAG: metallophosphoesterase, partial [Kiritimatiellae bacterium]|nr:metallophosphoesterase [Kiritimatiellia bacterium]